jgi:energy-coupling factor transporter ATP-binding protein EcfA2
MVDELFSPKSGRKTVVTGHYGSGKTEFSVSLAMLLAEKVILSKDISGSSPYSSLALIDLDIVNPYFRSREQREILESAGISLYGSMFDTEITAELPALGATVRKPLEDKNCRVIIDLGGNDIGAMIINQFKKYFTDNDTEMLAVINTNRPETATVKDILSHISAIQAITGLSVSKLINNTHMLHETTVEDILSGNDLCKEVSQTPNIPILCNCYSTRIIDESKLSGLIENLLPLGLYLRPTWLDI